MSNITRWRMGIIVLGVVLGGCANHPLDCAVGFHHSDCLPGTAGYDNPNKFAAVDNQQCRSYGFKPGTDAYANCMLKLTEMHEGAEPQIETGVGVVVPAR